MPATPTSSARPSTAHAESEPYPAQPGPFARAEGATWPATPAVGCRGAERLRSMGRRDRCGSRVSNASSSTHAHAAIWALQAGVSSEEPLPERARSRRGGRRNPRGLSRQGIVYRHARCLYEAAAPGAGSSPLCQPCRAAPHDAQRFCPHADRSGGVQDGRLRHQEGVAGALRPQAR